MLASKHVEEYLKIHASSAQVVKIKVVDLVESFRMVVSRPLYDQIRPQLGQFYVLRVSFLITIFLIQSLRAIRRAYLEVVISKYVALGGRTSCAEHSWPAQAPSWAHMGSK